MRYYELTVITQNLPQLPIQPIKEQKGPNFITLEFYAEPGKISELEKELKANSLRYMILAKEPQKEVKLKRKPPTKEPFLVTKFPASRKKTGGKVDLEALDKKLKEILEE